MTVMSKKKLKHGALSGSIYAVLNDITENFRKQMSLNPNHLFAGIGKSGDIVTTQPLVFFHTIPPLMRLSQKYLADKRRATSKVGLY